MSNEKNCFLSSIAFLSAIMAIGAVLMLKNNAPQKLRNPLDQLHNTDFQEWLKPLKHWFKELPISKVCPCKCCNNLGI